MIFGGHLRDDFGVIPEDPGTPGITSPKLGILNYGKSNPLPQIVQPNLNSVPMDRVSKIQIKSNSSPGDSGKESPRGNRVLFSSIAPQNLLLEGTQQILMRILGFRGVGSSWWPWGQCDNPGDSVTIPVPW